MSLSALGGGTVCSQRGCSKLLHIHVVTTTTLAGDRVTEGRREGSVTKCPGDSLHKETVARKPATLHCCSPGCWNPPDGSCAFWALSQKLGMHRVAFQATPLPPNSSEEVRGAGTVSSSGTEQRAAAHVLEEGDPGCDGDAGSRGRNGEAGLAGPLLE